MLIELTMLTFAATSTGATAGPVASTPITAPIERPSALGDDSSRPGPILLAASAGSGSRSGRSTSKNSSNRGAGGYQQTGQGGYQQTGQGGYQGGSGQGNRDMNITPPNTPPGLHTTPPASPQWSPQWSPPGN